MLKRTLPSFEVFQVSEKAAYCRLMNNCSKEGCTEREKLRFFLDDRRFKRAIIKETDWPTESEQEIDFYANIFSPFLKEAPRHRLPYSRPSLLLGLHFNSLQKAKLKYFRGDICKFSNCPLIGKLFYVCIHYMTSANRSHIYMPHTNSRSRFHRPNCSSMHLIWELRFLIPLQTAPGGRPCRRK